MVTVNTSLDAKLAVSRDVFSSSNLIFGSLMFLILSLIRGISYVSVSYVSANYSNLITVVIAFSPLSGLLVPNSLVSRWRKLLIVPVLLWFISTLVSNLMLKLVLILILQALVFISLRQILLHRNFRIISGVNPSSLMMAILLDQGIRVANHGSDPILVYSSRMSMLVVLVFGLIWIGVLYSTLSSRTGTEAALFSSESKNTNNMSAGGLILLLVVYLTFFGNSGVLTLNSPLADNTILLSALVFPLLMLITYFIYTKARWLNLITVLAPIILLLALYIFPGYGFLFIIWILGYMALVWLILKNLETMQVNHKYTSRGISLSIAFAYIVAILGIVLYLFTESIYIGLALGLLGGIFTLVPYFRSMEANT